MQTLKLVFHYNQGMDETLRFTPPSKAYALIYNQAKTTRTTRRKANICRPPVAERCNAVRIKEK